MNVTLRLAWRNLWRHKRRTWLTVGAMIFSNVLLVFMISLQLGSYRMMIDNGLKTFTGHMQVQQEGYLDDPKMRRSVPGILPLAGELRSSLATDLVAARGLAFALASSEERSHGLQIVGVEPEFEPRVSSLPGLVKEGRYLQGNSSFEIVIGRILARNLKVGVGDELTLLGSGRDGSFAAGITTIVGILDSGMPDLDRSLAQMPIVTFQEIFAMGDHGHLVVVEAQSLGEVSALQAKVDTEIQGREGLAVLDWNALEPGLRQAIQADLSSAMFMYGVLIVLVAFSVLNTQLMSVLERTREFGIILALGLRPGNLGRLVMLETSMMAGLGLLIGVGLGYLLTLWISHVGFYYPGMEEQMQKFNLPDRMYPSISLLSMLVGPGIVFLGSVLAAIYPALRLHRLQPVEAMRAV